MPKVKCDIYWRCNLNKVPKLHRPLIQGIVKDLVRQIGAVQANIRADIHDTTTAGGGGIDPNTGRRRVTLDPLGDHITFEILNPESNMWINFHFYVSEIEVGSQKRWIKNPNIDPNPVAYPPKIVAKAKIIIDGHGVQKKDPKFTYEYELD